MQITAPHRPVGVAECQWCVIPHHLSVLHSVRTFFGRSRALTVDWPWPDVHREVDRAISDAMLFWPYRSPLGLWRAWDDPHTRPHPVDIELYRCANPIVDENGVTVFKLEFDVRRFAYVTVCLRILRTRFQAIRGRGEDEE